MLRHGSERLSHTRRYIRVREWAARFPLKIAGWAARRAAQGAAACAMEEAQFAAHAVQWAAEDRERRERQKEERRRIGMLVRTGLRRRRGGRRGVGSNRRRRRRDGKERRWHRRAGIRRAWMREGWRRAEIQWERRQEAKWQSKGGKGSRWRLVQRKQRPAQVSRAGIWQQRRRGEAGEHRDRAPASLCRRQHARVAGAGWGHSPRYWRLGGGGKCGWVT